MRIAPRKRLWPWARGLLRRTSRGIVILLYHRVAEHVPDPQLLCVSAAHFAEHLEHLSGHYTLMSQHQVVHALQRGRIPRKAVAITFDDGYVDNLSIAKPLLERRGCPATVFVVSGFVGSNRELVSDELERILLASASLPPELVLTVAGRTYSWSLGHTGAQQGRWDVTQEHYPTLRHKCYHGLHRLLRPLDHAGRLQTLAELSSWAGNREPVRRDRLVMNAEEVRGLVAGGLVDVGSHGASHILLAAQSAEVQRHEIVASKTSLESVLGRSVTSLSYPYGGAADFDESTLRFVREAGYESACANVAALATRDSNPFALPRILVRDWDGDEFSRRLHEAFNPDSVALSAHTP